jgi:MerR family copper efflux transcriptional regulator
MKSDLLTIGEVAKRAGLAPSAIRYYETEGLLNPEKRTASGYRMYLPQAVRQLLFIKRAQQLGFSLQDVKHLLGYQQGKEVSATSLVQLVEDRYLEIERQVTNLLIHRHEMGIFMQTLYDQLEDKKTLNGSDLFSQMIERVCSDPMRRPLQQVLDWLIDVTHCHISFEEAYAILQPLRGMHFHLWREEDTYFILVISKDQNVFRALDLLADFEADCTAHSSAESMPPGISIAEDGYLLKAKGKNAFIYARLFLALENQTINFVSL